LKDDGAKSIVEVLTQNTTVATLELDSMQFFASLCEKKEEKN
jgi:hypothetical protein